MFREVDSLILVCSDHLRFTIVKSLHLRLAQKIDNAGYPERLHMPDVTFAVWIRANKQILINLIRLELIPKTTIANL